MRITVTRAAALGLVCALVVAPPIVAQGAAARQSTEGAITSVFQRDLGVLVELAGLRHWTPARVDSAVNGAGQSLFGESYSVRRVAGIFPQSVIFQRPSDSVVTVFMALIEPEDARLVTVRRFPAAGAAGSIGPAARRTMPWLALGAMVNAPIKMLDTAMLDRVHLRAVGLRSQLSSSTLADSADLLKVWRTLDAHTRPTDAEAARRVLLGSPNMKDRIAAIAVLSSFDRDDATWHALAGALLDPDEEVRRYARKVLAAFTTDLPRRVDWRPAATTLHALLQGSDLFSLRDVLDMLVATGVGSELAAPVLKDGGHAVLLFAGAKELWAREPAQRFLRAISGRDMTAPAEWRTWVAGL